MSQQKKRTVVRQRNPPVEDIQTHYRVAYYYAFLDHTLSHLKTRFSKTLLLATYLLPEKVAQITDETVDLIKSEFQHVLPRPAELEHEIKIWKVHVSRMDGDGATMSLLSVCNLVEKNQIFYPNICTAMLLLLSLPVGSCSCERSFISKTSKKLVSYLNDIPG